MQNYDVVVVEAGNAGLTAAIKAQKRRKKTLLIEKNNVPGGQRQVSGAAALK